MSDEELRSLLQTEPEMSRGWRCPDENEVAKYMAAQLVGDSKRRFEAHIANCDACRQLIGFLFIANDWPEAEPVPPNLLARVRNLVVKPRAFWWWRWQVATAAAAIVITGCALFALRPRGEPPPSRESGALAAQQRQSEIVAAPIPSPVETPRVFSNRSSVGSKTATNRKPTVRGKTDMLQPSVLFPVEGAVIRREQLNLRWTQSHDAVFYQVKLVSADGSLLFQRNDLNDTQLRIPDEVRLVSGNKYFVSVVAHTREGRIRTSELVGFRITP